MHEKDYYTILGVAEDASKDEIKKEYRKLAVKYHPDKGEADSDDRMKEINEAYTVLSNDDKRSRYDMERKYGSIGGNAGDNFYDIFNNMFRGGMYRRRDPNAPARGRDINYAIGLPLRFFIFGGDYSFEIKYHDMCKTCNGTGAKKSKQCTSCGGSGQQTHRQQQGNNVFINTVPCASCGGKGYIIEEKCSDCSDGSILLNKEVTIEVPKGIENGHILKKNGYGFLGKNGGSPGDMYIKLSIVLPKEEDLTSKQREVLSTL